MRERDREGIRVRGDERGVKESAVIRKLSSAKQTARSIILSSWDP